MARYWDAKTFYQERNRLSKLIESENDPVRKDYLQGVLEMTDFIYMQHFSDYQMPTYLERHAMHNLTASVVSSSRYFTVIEEYIEGLDEAMEKTDAIDSILDKRMKDNTDLNALVNTKTTPRQAISSLFRFYEGFDKELFDLFKEAYDSSFLTFYFKNNSILPEGSDGRTYFMDGLRENFIAIINSGDARLVNNLVHEYGHAIKNLLTPEAAYTNEYDYFAEVPSIFPELVSFEENVGGYPQLAMDYLKYDNFVEYHNNAFSLLQQPYIYLQWKNNGFNINRRFKKRLLEEDGLNNEEYHKSLEVDISSEGGYVLSYITSLELLHIYREDKKEALKLFKELLQLVPSTAYLGEVKKVIPLNRYAKEETEKIIDDLALSLKRRF